MGSIWNIEDIFEILKEQESRYIFNNDSYLMIQAIEKSKTMKFLSYYASIKGPFTRASVLF